MTETLAFLPQATLDGDAVRFVVDEEVYPLEAIHGACWSLLDRAFIRLDRPADRQVGVRLLPRGPDRALDLALEFCDRMLGHAARLDLAERLGRVRELHLARLFANDPAQASIDALLAELDEEDLAEDALEIEVPWAEGGDDA